MRHLVLRLLSTVLFVSIVLLVGCNTYKNQQFTPHHRLSFQDSCKFEPDHYYSISLADHPDPEQKFPLVIAIDPHGDGKLAVQKFRDALKGLPVVVAGSDKLRNNYPGFELSLNNLKNDLLSKYPVDPNMLIVAGFSGGARMALYYGLKNQVHGIIMFGAGPGQIQGGFQEKQIYAVSGTRDFNFNEQYRLLFSDLEGRSAYVNDYFRGTHEWPPESNIRESVVYCLRSAKGAYQSLSNKLSEDFVEAADSLVAVKDFLFAGKALEKAFYFAAGKRRQDMISRRISDFEQNPAWIASQQKIENFLSMEARTKQLYAENLQDPDMDWWSGELNSLFTQISIVKDPLEGDYYARMKGFLGIYLYSRINTLLQQGNASDLMDRMMEIYEDVEPGSEDLGNFKLALSQLRDKS